jgi:putative DNA methylase
MSDTPRLIEHAFPLKQASLDSVHEKMCHAGHIKAIHIWPARRPLAASRAALIATLLPDPGTPEKRKELCEKIGGKVVKRIERKKMPNGEIVERQKEITEGGILHWGRETENKEDLGWFRQEIRNAHGGRAPKVIDPFAGGGAIPLEAMRLGCDVTAVDINPVAWFILKCTLEYPQKLTGKAYPLPDFILHNENFMNAFYKAHPHLAGRTKQTKKQKDKFAEDLFLKDKADSGRAPKADLSWHVRAWGQWVLDQARRELARFYPTYADFEPLDSKNPKSYEKQPMRLCPVKEDGRPGIDVLNADFSKEYLAEKRNPRWIAKPTLAYLWARSVQCKNCRTIIPLFKSRWLCKKNNKRVLLTVDSSAETPNVVFGIETNVPVKGGNAAQRREHDKRIGAGTMSRSGAKCPCCPAIMTTDDIRVEGNAGRLGILNTAVVVNGQNGKEYRLPTDQEIRMSTQTETERIYAELPFGLPEEPIPQGASRASGGSPFTVYLYGLTRWCDLFTARQLLALGVFLKWTREVRPLLKATSCETWNEAITAYLACAVAKVADYNSNLVDWQPAGQKGGHTFMRWALPIKWDFTENSPIDSDSGGWRGIVDWISKPLSGALVKATETALPPAVLQGSAINISGQVDVVLTDPPYYDAIPYSDLMDFFYVFLRRIMRGVSPETDNVFKESLSPKWNSETNDGELIDDASRHSGDGIKSRAAYEDGMFRAFRSAHNVLKDDGRLVIVFAHKQPDAWETLVSGIIRAGFVVDGSWPIQTEMANRTRAMSSAALASSVWLVCKKRPHLARPGWDTQVLDEMHENIRIKLRDFWDAGIQGPDFIWAATGPALEAYSKHPVVKKANDPGKIMDVSEFLSHVRRMVVDFVVGRVLTRSDEDSRDLSLAERLDEPTAYYLLHRNDFQFDEAPAGACILYAVSCGVSDKELADTWDIITFTKGNSSDETSDDESDADGEPDPDTEEDSGSKVKLKSWVQRKGRSLGYEAPSGKSVPLIDRVHRLMHLWKAGELVKVDEYLDSNGLRRQELFKRLVQSLIELSPRGTEERSLLESLTNHIGGKGALPDQIDIRDDTGRWRAREVIKQE